MNKAEALTIHTDGAARGNPGPAAFAYVIDREGQPPIEEAGCLGKTTNNQAEYTTLVRALEHAARLGTRHRLIVHSDSELMVKQVRGEYKVKNDDLRGLWEEARELAAEFDGGVTLKHVRREANRRADQLCNDALDGKRELGAEEVRYLVEFNAWLRWLIVTDIEWVAAWLAVADGEAEMACRLRATIYPRLESYGELLRMKVKNNKPNRRPSRSMSYR